MNVKIPYVRIKGRELPRVLLGTSPFLGAGQFGVKAYEYYRKFFKNPARVTELVAGCIEIGVNGVQLVAYPQIGDAVKKAEEKKGARLKVVGSLPFDMPSQALKYLSEFDTVAALLHGEQTDKLNMEENRAWLKRIEDEGYLVGVATHNPARTLPIVIRELEVDIVMMPLNKAGYMMGGMKGEEFMEIVESSGAKVIAMKPLAAGKINPREAMGYVFSLKNVASVAVGVASLKEAEETFSAAATALSRLKE
ncbi:MAG: hypothetical protein KIH01_01680 [Candidatus Freyarchaeota archaeon]|nr:hypothetical protein [Candidatus Jordarchaeia archaeon]